MSRYRSEVVRLIRCTTVVIVLVGLLHAHINAAVLKEAKNEAGDWLAVTAIEPPPGTVLKGGDKVNVTIEYKMAGTSAQIWAMPDSRTGDGFFFAASDILTKTSDHVLRFVGSNSPGQMNRIKVRMVRVPNEKNTDTLVELALDVAYKWEGENPATAPVAVVGQPIPELKFKSVDGTDVDLAKMKGKVVLVDFWATWCGPCLREMPHLLEAYAAYKEFGFEIIGISLDSDREAMERFLKENKITWPQYFDGQGWKNAIAQKFNVQHIPHYFLLDRQGIVRHNKPLGPDLKAAVQKLCGAGETEASKQTGEGEAPLVPISRIPEERKAAAWEAFEKINAAQIRGATLSADRIYGSDRERNQLTPGTILFCKTTQGRWSKVLIEEHGYDLMIAWTTYADEDGKVIFSQGKHLKVPGTGGCDLDLGLARGDAEFMWSQETPAERYLEPCSGALLAIHRP